MKKNALRRFLSFFLVLCMLLSNYSGMGMRTVRAEEPSGAESGSGNSEDEIEIGPYIYSVSQKSILRYTGSEAVLSIPGSLEWDETSYPVQKIGPGAFAREDEGERLTSLTLPEGITEIGDRAFIRNKLTSLILPKSLKSIGESAFRYNALTSLTIPGESPLSTLGANAFASNALTSLDLENSALTEIPAGAFAHNNLTEIKFPANLTAIGDEAFLDNRFTSLTLPDTITTMGSGVFNKNGRYVFVSTKSDAVKTDAEKGSFGMLKNPVKLWVVGLDSKTHEVVLSPMEDVNDPMTEAPLNSFLVQGADIERTAPLVKGYRADKIRLRLPEGDDTGYTKEHPYTIYYERVSNPPKILGLNPLNIPIGGTCDLTQGVTATDEFGTDLTFRIQIQPDTIDTSEAGEYKVKYTVTDDAGNEVTEYRTVYVGIDPMEIEVGRGWLTKDFTYSGNKVTGLSASGIEKLATNKFLALPSFNPHTEDREPITEVASSAFSGRGLATVDLPDSIEKIDSNAFDNNEITTIRYSEKLKEIGSNAFRKNKLTEVKLPESVRTIGQYAFYENLLRSVQLPEGIEELGAYSFALNRITKVDLPESLLRVGDYAFQKNQISNLSMKENLQSIGAYAFSENRLTNVSFPEKIQSIGNYAFSKNDLMAAVIPDSVTSLGEYAFTENKITSYVLPAGLTKIPNGLFRSNQLRTVPIPSHVTSIGDYAFSQNRIVDADIPGNVTDIGNYTFYENYELKTVKFNEGLTNIGSYAFSKTSLNMPVLSFPSTTRSIGDYAFDGSGISNLSMVASEIILNEGLQSIGVGSFRSLYADRLTLPSTLTIIPDNAFQSNGLKDLTLPDQITSIGHYAFNNNRLITLHLPAELKTIGEYAFYSNYNLKALTLPDKLESIGSYAFASNKIRALTVPDSVKTIGSYAFSSNSLQTLTLPDSIESLGSYAFFNNQLTEARIPVLIKNVPSGLFDTNRLEKVTLAPGTTEIGSEAFQNNRLTSIDFPGTLKTIGSYAFDTNRLSTVNLPDSVTSLGAYSFQNNVIETLTLSKALTSIPSYAFYNNRLTELPLPDGITSIESYAFYRNAIDSFTVTPESGLSSISDNAFGYNRLMEVTLPTSVKSIHTSAFYKNSGWSHEPGKVLLLLKDSAGEYKNPHRIQDSSYQLVNKAVVRVKSFLNGTRTPVAADRYVWGDYGTTIHYTPPTSEMYRPVNSDPIPVKLTQPETSIEVPYEFEAAFNPEVLTLEVKHADSYGRNDENHPYGLKSFYTGSTMPLRITVRNTATGPTIKDAIIEVDLNKAIPGGHIKSVSWPSNIKTLAKDYKLENGRITVQVRGEIGANYALELPIFLTFESNNTPNGYTLDLTESVYVTQNGLILKKNTQPLGLRAKTSSNSYYKSSYAQTQGRADEEGYLLPGSDTPIRYSYSVSSSGRTTNHLFIRDQIPTYKGKENGVIKTDLKAVFVPELSPGWQISADGNYVELDLPHSAGYGGTGSSIPQCDIYFRFPGALTGTSIYNSMEFKETQVDRRHTLNGSDSEAEAKFTGTTTVYEEEPLMTGSSSASTYLTPYTDPSIVNPPTATEPTPYVRFNKRSMSFYGDSSGAIVPEQTTIDRHAYYNFRNSRIDWYSPERNISKDGSSHYENVFYDNAEDRNKEFLWAIGIEMYGYGGKEIEISDYDLDSRMRYTGIQIPEQASSAVLTLYSKDEQGEREIYRGTIYGDRYDLTVEQSKLTTRFTLRLNGEFTNTKIGTVKLATRVYTRFRDPDLSQFSYDGVDSYGRSSKNCFYNKASLHMKTINLNGQASDLTKKDENEHLCILPWESKVSFSKETVDASRTRDQNDTVSYYLTITTNKPKEDKMTDLKVLDLLPKYVIPQKVIFQENFLKNAGNPRYEIVENYNGSGRFAVIIRADAYNANGPELQDFADKFVRIDAVTGIDITSGTSVNEAYLSAKGNGYWNTDQPSTVPDYPLFEGDRAALKGTSSFPVLLGAVLKGYKFVKSSTDTVWQAFSTRLSSGQEFEYKLQISNPTSINLGGLEIFDTLPYNGDYRLVPNEEGDYIPRRTELRGKMLTGEMRSDKVSLRGPVRMDSNLIGKFDVYYTKESPEALKKKNPKILSANTAIWLTEEEVGTSWDQITALRIVAKEGVDIPSQAVQNFYLDMKAPENPDYMFDGDKAINSFALRTGSSGTYVEGNNVEVEMYSVRGSVRVNKIGKGTEKGASVEAPLPGVSFRLWPVAIPNYDDEKDTKTLGNYKVLKDPVSVLFGEVPETTIVTNALGYVIFDELKLIRDYVLEEVSAPEGYLINPRFTLITKDKIKNAGPKHAVSLSLINKKQFTIFPIKAPRVNLEFYKMDKNGNPLPNTVFRIQSDPAYPEKIDQTVTSTDTGLVRFTDLPNAGSRYPFTITEVVPRGALQPLAPFRVNVMAQNTKTMPDGSLLSVQRIGEKRNDQANLLIYKLGIFNLREQAKELQRLTPSSGKRLSGVRLELQNEAGTMLQEAVTNERGEANFRNLELNTNYYVAEPVPPASFRNYENTATNNRLKVRIDEFGNLYMNDVLSSNSYAVFPNYPLENVNRVDIQKLDNRGRVLPGAEFALYEIENPGENEIAHKIDTQTTDAEGNLAFKGFGTVPGNTPGGVTFLEKTFEIREVKSPIGYLRRFDPFRFTTSSENLTYHVLDAVNPVITLEVRKYENGDPKRPLSGAEFSLYEGSNAEGSLLEKLTTGQDGVLHFTYHSFDTSKQYFLKETKLPEGYKNAFEILIDLPGLLNRQNFKGSLVYNVSNVKETGSFVLTKLNQDTNQPVAGAKFVLRDTDTTKPEAERNGVSKKDGTVMFTGLTLGKTYEITETKAAPGYTLPENPTIRFTVGDTMTIRRSMVNLQKTGSLTIIKKDELGNLLKNAEFVLEKRLAGSYYGEPVLKTTDANGSITFTDLHVGQIYRLRETDASRISPTAEVGASLGYKKKDTVWEITVSPSTTINDPASVNVRELGGSENLTLPLQITDERNELPKVRVDVDKTFTGGENYADLPSIYALLYKTNVAGVKTLVERKEMTRDLTSQSLRFTASFENLPYDEGDSATKTWRPLQYSVEEEMEGAGKALYTSQVTADVQNAANTYLKSFHITNSFTIPTGRVSGNKVWENGPATRPDTYLALYRSIGNSAAERVPGTDVKLLQNGADKAHWDGIELTKADGTAYIFSVRETNSTGEDSVPANYSKTENGLTVTNAYIIPNKGVAKAQKIWKDGPTVHPTTYFKLYRKTENGTEEEVLGADIKALPNGVTEVQWSALDETDLHGSPYTFSVKEVNADGEDATPANYTKTEKGLTVTNQYVIPKNGKAKATKNWVHGPSTHPVVWFKLYRHTDTGAEEAVPNAEIKELSNNATTVEWTGLDETDINGKAYTFTVKETNAQGEDFTPENYTKEEKGLTVTNTYVIPRDAEATGVKKWVKGSNTHPTTYLKLYRSVQGGKEEAVPDAPLGELLDTIESYTWRGLERTDLNGNPYTFSVKETDAAGQDASPLNYTKEEQGLTVTNTYVIPMNGRAIGRKVWEHGPANRPTVWLKLYRRVANGVEEAVPNVEIKALSSGTLTAEWTGLEETDIDGRAYDFSVKETDANGMDFNPLNYQKTESGLTVTNTYVIPKIPEVSARKIWKDGADPRPTTHFRLYRSIGNGPKEPVPNANILELSAGQTEVKWQNLDATDLDGNPYTFHVKETDENGLDFTPLNYTKTESGLSVTNQYVIPKNGKATASKTWINGSDTHPTVWFKLYRSIPNGREEAVPKTELKVLKNGTTEVAWTGLEETDIQGRPYTFSVKEVNEEGKDSAPKNYTKNEQGLSVTNTYVIPKNGKASATKTWVNGSDTHPVVWLKLYRQVAGGQVEEVPDIEPLSLPNGTLSAEWTGLHETDLQGRPYVFSVKEVNAQGVDFVPDHYSKTEDGLHVTNTYVIPRDASATATKSWVNGSNTHPTIWLKLYRHIKNGTPEEVPEADIAELKTGTESHTWTNLERTDSKARPYTFTVKEVNSKGEDASPENYAKDEINLHVTNTYVIPTNGRAVATKTWVNGPQNRPTIWLKLYRQITGGVAEEVPETEIKELTSNRTSVEWTGLEETDLQARPYTFTVRETNANGEDFTPANYRKTESGLNVTNTYVIPTNGRALATKKWKNGPSVHPTVWLKLYRKTDASNEEAVPGAELKELKNGTLTAEWTGLEETDLQGNTYTFSVHETDANGQIFVPTNYKKTEEGLTVTNSYVIPKNGIAEGEKLWVNGPAKHPTIWMKLYRQIPGGREEAVPDAEIKKLESGTTKARWTGLDETDIQGNYYTFSVRETDAEGNAYVPENYQKKENGLSITNSYVIPKVSEIRANKVWENGPTDHEPIYLKLFRHTDVSDLEAVPNAELRKIIDGATTVRWTNLDKTDINGNEYIFSVEEVDANGNSYVPDEYRKSENALTVTNTYVIPNNGKVKANKVWRFGPEEHPTVWLKLFRKTAVSDIEAVPEAGLKVLKSGVTEAEWTGLDEKDSKGNRYIFLVRETNEQGDAFVPENYEKSETGLTVTNTYVIPKNGVARAYKFWKDGPSVHPTVWLRLYRALPNGDPEPVPGVEILAVRNGEESVVWTGLEETDIHGQEYTFSVRETDIAGRDFVPKNYTKKETGLIVVNSYQIPTDGKALASKIWNEGPEDHPTVWLKLYREIKGGRPEAVPGAELKELKNGITEVKWIGLEETDIKGNAYTFSVQETNAKGEAFTPENYVSKADDLSVTNTYVIPKNGTAVAEKIWLNGPEDHPTVWLKLYREIKGGRPEAVPGAELKELTNGITKTKWTGLEETDIKGNAYIFSVQETNAKGEAFTPKNYVSKADGLSVTNTYVIPKNGTAVAKKIWVNGPEDHPTVWLKLYREIKGGRPEAVPGAELKELTNGITEAKWTGLEETDIRGNAYIFSVQETNEKGEAFTPENYASKAEGLKVTNTYIIPKTAEALATKTWINGPETHPTVWLKLYREIKGGRPEAVPGAELKELTNGITEARWTGLEKTDTKGNIYTFSVQETNEKGEAFTPENYTSKADGLKITNTYVIPMKGRVTARKIWVGGPESKPVIYFKLYRRPEGEKEWTAVPKVKIQKLTNGMAEVSWTDLEETNDKGQPYEFSVREVNKKGKSYAPKYYEKKEEGLQITNTWKKPSLPPGGGTETGDTPLLPLISITAALAGILLLGRRRKREQEAE